MNDFATQVTSRENKKHVIFINRFYWPDESATSQLLADLAEYLSSNGMQVSVVTSRLNYTNSQKRLPAQETHHGVRIHRIWSTAFHRISIVGRLLDFLTFYVFATIFLLSLVRRDDVVIAKTDPPLIQVFAWLATTVKRGKLINWCQDLFPEIIHASGMTRNKGPVSAVLRHLRNFTLRQSAFNVTISNEMSTTLVCQGISQNRMRVITNWCDRLIEPVSSETNDLRQRWRLENQFVIGYSGNLGRAHNPDEMNDLVNELKDIDDLKFLFIGSGHGMRQLKEQCRQQEHDHVVFKPYQPRASLSLSLSVPDIHLISLRHGCQHFLAPSKLYGILAAGRPIAFFGDPECDLAREVKESGLGIRLRPDDPASWKELIRETIKDKAKLTAMGANARQAYESRYEAAKSLGAWQQIIEQSQTDKTPAGVSSTISAMR